MDIAGERMEGVRVFGSDLERIKWMLGGVAFLGLNIADCLLASLLIKSGLGWEANLIWARISVWYKMIPAVIIAAFLLRGRKGILLPLNIGMSFIVLWNFLIFAGVFC